MKTMTSQHYKRSQIDCSEPLITDQSGGKDADINNIMARYVKTKQLPNIQNKVAQFIDNTMVPSLEDAHNLLQQAKELFYSLPSSVRKIINNDPKKLPELLNDPDHTELLIKHKILERSTKSEDDSNLSSRTDAPAAEKTATSAT